MNDCLKAVMQLQCHSNVIIIIMYPDSEYIKSSSEDNTILQAGHSPDTEIPGQFAEFLQSAWR